MIPINIVGLTVEAVMDTEAIVPVVATGIAK